MRPETRGAYTRRRHGDPYFASTAALGRAIARETGLSRNTVRRYLAGKQAGKYRLKDKRRSGLAPAIAATRPEKEVEAK